MNLALASDLQCLKVMRTDIPSSSVNDPALYEMRRIHNDRTAGSVPVYKDGVFKFSDFIDMVNPLQHLPFVSSIYRKATGDEISSASEVMGGALYGGPVGAAASAMSRTISDDMEVKDNQALAMAQKQKNSASDNIALVIDDELKTLEGTTLAHADLSGKHTPSYAHYFRRYNE